jgi:hypothetical protein
MHAYRPNGQSVDAQVKQRRDAGEATREIEI